MKAVLCEVPADMLQWRSQIGADQWDEMWEGVLHMPPAPNRMHQDFQGELETWLRIRWAKPRGCKVYHDVNLASRGGWPEKDYRIPDFVLLTPDSSAVDHNEYFEGAPTAVIEIRSPGDETMEKLPFYAKLGVPEVWVIDRDTRTPSLYVLAGAEYEEQQLGHDQWLRSEATGIQFRAARGRQLEIQLVDRPDTAAKLPED
jgi:Uma2 family endonuclease